MKSNFNILLFLLLPVFIFSQNDKTVEVIYIKAYKNHRDVSDAEPKLMKNLEYQLLCNFNKSKFEYISSMVNDGDIINERFIGRGGGRGIYYKNLEVKENIHQRISPDDDELYLVMENFNKHDWTLLKETKKILGYDCFKAIANHVEYNPITKKEISSNIVVWYAPSLPLPFGPAGFDGLPGLVLESNVASFYFIAQEIKFHDKEKDIKRPIRGEEVTLEEYNSIIFQNWLKQTGKKN